MTSWHYELNGQRLGPLAEAQMAELVQQRVIGGSTLVWTQGSADWQPLERTSLAAHLSSPSAPPPLPGSRVPNGVVWVLAVAPVLGLLLESILAGALAQSESVAEEAMLVAIASGTYWYVSLALNLGLSYLDDWRLRRAGVDTSAFGKVAFLVPVYLWKRAKALGQRPLYFWTWIAGFVFVMLSAVGAAGLQEELQGSTMGSTGTAAESVVASEAASTALSPPTGGVQRVIQVRDNGVTTVGGELRAAPDEPAGSGQMVLYFNGLKLDRPSDDVMTLLTLYRYADRDVVVLTHACGGSACSYTTIAVMEIPAQGKATMFQHEDWTIAGDGQEPEVTVQPDGSLLMTFVGFKGRQTWRYADGELMPL